jgi:hypothetical protein
MIPDARDTDEDDVLERKANDRDKDLEVYS